MKTFNKMFFIVVISLIFITNCSRKNSITRIDEIEAISIEYNDEKIDEKSKVKIITKEELLKMNSRIESKGKWNVANRYGYMGKYQIGKLALIDLGYDTSWIKTVQNSIYEIKDTVVSHEDTIVRKFYYFDLSLFPPKKQEEVIRKLLNKNERVYLKAHINKYVGKEISGVRITKAGILSASFLGFGHVDKFLKSNGRINPVDKNGHSIKDRMLKFENYEII